MYGNGGGQPNANRPTANRHTELVLSAVECKYHLVRVGKAAVFDAMEARRRHRPQPQDVSTSTLPTADRRLNARGPFTSAAAVVAGNSPRRRDNSRRWWQMWVEIGKQAGPGGTLVALILAYILWCLAARLVLVSDETRHAHAKPRVFAYYFSDDVKSSRPSRRHLPGTLASHEPYPPHPRTTVEWTDEDEKGQKLLLNSQYYNNDEHRALRPYQDKPECVPMHEWHTMTYPTCNNVHQVDLTDLSYERNFEHRQVRILAHGFFRDVWAVREFDGVTLRVFKTLRYRHDMDEWSFERHRMDAVTFNELTSSERILDIYSFCGNSGAFEYAPGGAVSDVIYEEEPLPLEERFNIAVQMARAISDLHNFNHKAPAIAHADIYTNQFVAVDVGNGKKRYKLNDFNRCTFLYWNATSNAGNCPYEYGDYNAWLYRSPEEYEYGPQTEKIDVYSLGNILWDILTTHSPRGKMKKELEDKTRPKVARGELPPWPDDVNQTKLKTDPALKAINIAMRKCLRAKPEDRPTAGEIADELAAAVDALPEGFGDKEKWRQKMREKVGKSNDGDDDS